MLQRRSTQVRSQKNVGGTDRAPPANENQQSISRGEQVLQSLVSHGSNANASDASGPSGKLRPAFAQSIPTGRPNPVGLVLLMFEKHVGTIYTQSPSIRNTLDSIVQQIDGQELSNFAGMGRGQGGGIELSRMVQQMMPNVSQALTRGPTTPEPYGLDSGEQRLSDMGGAIRDDKPNEISQIDLQGVAQRIECNDPPGEIFLAVVEHTASLICAVEEVLKILLKNCAVMRILPMYVLPSFCIDFYRKKSLSMSCTDSKSFEVMDSGSQEDGREDTGSSTSSPSSSPTSSGSSSSSPTSSGSSTTSSSSSPTSSGSSTTSSSSSAPTSSSSCSSNSCSARLTRYRTIYLEDSPDKSQV
ncbi:Cytoplasmic trna 2-thiolation protein [Thalictrum thalictroides]|uniref:Cytoplasmic trna 2-thiolation protein n=1 Tax=Thalictrum thalictroides TaxID=46969 RepID=A0A7J6WV94_THATH|nr:Cytoplasmic trna 2-thiolation protein [Thalictrum thalictroides]